jgi:hypothetical protein
VGWQAVKSCSLIVIEMGGRTGSDRARVWFFLGWWSIPFSQELWDRIRYGVHSSPAVSYPDFLAVTDDMWYPGYQTLIVAPSLTSSGWSEPFCHTPF